MEDNIIEEKRNKLNLEIRSLLSIIDMIDGKQKEYENYINNSLNEIGFIEQQTTLIEHAKERLINIFKD